MKKTMLILILALTVCSTAFAMGGKPKDDFWNDLTKITKECYAVAGPTTGGYEQSMLWTKTYNACYYPKRKAAGCTRNMPSECNADISMYV